MNSNPVSGSGMLFFFGTLTPIPSSDLIF